MTEDEIIAFAGALPGVHVLTASEAGGAPEAVTARTPTRPPRGRAIMPR